MKRRDALRSLLAAAGALLAPRVVGAQARPVRIIVPVSPGGGVDTFARLIAAKIAERHRVEFVVENRTGGNSTIGGLDVNRAAPDGYTLLFHASTHIVAPLVMREVPYDPVTDFTPIALAGQAPLIHIIANKRPERTVAEIVAAVKKKPDDWSFATAQLGAPGHLAEVAFNQYNVLNIPIVRHRAGGQRRGRRSCADDDRSDSVALAAGESGQRARGRGHQQKAHAACSRHRDHDGARFAAARFRCLVGPVGTARHAGRCCRQAERLDQRGGQGAGRAGPPCGARNRARRKLARGVRAVHPRRF
jgi:hypothetical protein